MEKHEHPPHGNDRSPAMAEAPMHEGGAQTSSPGQLKDPVCGMNVTEQSPNKHEHAGRPYYFCSAGCKTKFIADPERYLKPEREVAAPETFKAVAGTIYTCPMHPEIRQDHPGHCPKCGMSLEPLMPSMDDDKNPELKDFSRRFLWTLPLTVVVTVLAMFGHQLGLFAMATQSWVELVVSRPMLKSPFSIALTTVSPHFKRQQQIYRLTVLQALG